MLLDYRSLDEVAAPIVVKPIRVGGGYPRQEPYRPIPARRLDPALWLVLYAVNAIDEQELTALLAAR